MLAKRRSNPLARIAGRPAVGRWASKEHLTSEEHLTGTEELVRAELSAGEAQAMGKEGLLRAELAGRGK